MTMSSNSIHQLLKKLALSVMRIFSEEMKQGEHDNLYLGLRSATIIKGEVSLPFFSTII